MTRRDPLHEICERLGGRQRTGSRLGVIADHERHRGVRLRSLDGSDDEAAGGRVARGGENANGRFGHRLCRLAERNHPDAGSRPARASTVERAREGRSGRDRIEGGLIDLDGAPLFGWCDS